MSGMPPGACTKHTPATVCTHLSWLGKCLIYEGCAAYDVKWALTEKAVFPKGKKQRAVIVNCIIFTIKSEFLLKSIYN